MKCDYIVTQTFSWRNLSNEDITHVLKDVSWTVVYKKKERKLSEQFNQYDDGKSKLVEQLTCLRVYDIAQRVKGNHESKPMRRPIGHPFVQTGKGRLREEKEVMEPGFNPEGLVSEALLTYLSLFPVHPWV